MERIGQHGFPCGLWHATPRQLEAAVLRRPPAGPLDQALEGGLCPGPLSQLPELHVGPALPALSIGGAVALGGGVGVGVCCGVMGTGGGGGPGGVLVVLCPGDARGAGACAYADPWVRGHGLHFEVRLGSAGAAVAGHLLDVGKYGGFVGGQGRCWLALALLRSSRGRSVGLGCGLSVVAGRGASRLGRNALCHEGGGGGVGDGGGGGTELGAAVSGSAMAGAEGRRERPRGVGLALSPWRRASAWAWVWQRAEAVVRRRVCVAAWWRSWVSAGLPARAFLGGEPWWGGGGRLRWGRVCGPVWEVFLAAWGMVCWTRM